MPDVRYDTERGVYSFVFDGGPGTHRIEARATNGSGLATTASVSVIKV